jgi:hypothetical protein
MTEALRHIANITRHELGGRGVWPGVEHRHLSLALDIVLPLVGIRMPVHFAHAARLDRHHYRCNRQRRVEVAGVGDTDRTAGIVLDRFHVREMEGERVGRHAGGRCDRLLVGIERAGHLALEDPALL